MNSEAKRKAEAAPDREKLLAFASKVSAMHIGTLGTVPGISAWNEIHAKKESFAAWIRGKAGEL